MAPSYSFTELVEFLSYASDMGLHKAGTMVAWRTAASKVADDLTEQEADDVRVIDLDLLFQRYVNRNKVEVSPSTLKTYKQRLGKAIDEFVQWRDDPTHYKPTNTAKPAKKRAENRQPKPRDDRGEEPETPTTQPAQGYTASEPVTKALTLPFPLRPDFLATVQIPRDLRRSEADRLAAFIKTLATDVEGSERG